MNFSLNILGLFKDMDYDQIFPLMKQKGFSTIELWSLEGIDLAALKAAMERHGVRLSTCCPSFFVLNEESCIQQYIVSLRRVLAQIARLGCRTLITQVGNDTGAPRQVQHAAIVKGLKAVVPILEAAGVTLLVEPLNTVKDHVGYYLSSSEEGFAIVDEVGSCNVRILFDVYHQVHMGEDVLPLIEKNLTKIAHFHIAGHPNRDDKIYTNFDYRTFFALLQKHDVRYPVGVELFPKTTQDSLALLDTLAPYNT